MLSGKCTLAFLIQTDSLLWCFWFLNPAFRVTQAVWCRTWRVWNANRIFHKRVGRRGRREEQEATKNGYRLEAALTAALTLQPAGPPPKSAHQRNQWKGQIKWKKWLGKSDLPFSLHTLCWEGEGARMQARLWKEKKKSIKLERLLRLIYLNLPILWIRKLRGRGVASRTARIRPQFSIQYPSLLRQSQEEIGWGETGWHEVCWWMRFQDKEAKICWFIYQIFIHYTEMCKNRTIIYVSITDLVFKPHTTG